MSTLLPDVCTIQYGFPFDSAKFSTTHGTPLIRIRDVVRGYSETYTTEKYSDEYIVNDGDLLIGMDGEFNIAKWNGGEALLNQRVCRLVPKDSIDKGYLFYFMPQALKRIEEKTPFATVKHLSAKQLNAIVVPMPPLAEQQQIAVVLDTVSNLISLHKQQLAKLDILVKSQFIEMFESITDRTPIESISVNGPQNGFYRKDDGSTPNTHIVKMKELFANECIADETSFDMVNMSPIEQMRFTLTPADLLFGRRSLVVAGAGKCRRVGEIKISLAFESSLLRVTLDTTKILPRYAQAWFDTDEGKQAIASIRAVTTIAGIKGSDLKKVKLPIPPMAQQEGFTSFVQQTDKSKLTIQKCLDKLELLKKSLMQHYFG